MIPVFSTTNSSFLGLESDAEVTARSPKAIGFEDDAFIATYAHNTLCSEIGFDIIALIDGELQNVPEQPCKVVSPNRTWDAVLIVRKRNEEGFIQKRNRYYAYAALPQDVITTREDIENHAK